MTSFHPRRDLGILNDADLSMRSHVQRTVAGCFAVLRQLCSVGRSVPSFVFQTLIVSLVLMKLDFGNATLAGLPTYLLNRFQSVLNAAARSIAGLRRSVTSLTLLPVFTGFVLLSASISNWRSLYTELCTALHLDTCLTFFAALLTCCLVVVYGRRLPANLTSARRVSSLSETVDLPLLDQSSGRVSPMTLHRPHRCQYSERN